MEKETPQTATAPTKELRGPKPTGYVIESSRTPATPPEEGLFYNWGPIMSKNRLFSAVVGIRGGGKTYGATKFLVNAFQKKKKKSIWMKRQVNAMDDEFLRGFFAKIARNGEFPDLDFMVSKSSVKGVSYGYVKDRYSFEWIPIVLFIPLYSCPQHQGVVSDDYSYIWFDEFLVDRNKNNQRYINGWDEPNIFFEYFESVNRLRDMRAIFIGNSLGSINPYFSAWNIKMAEDSEGRKKEWTLTEHVVIHYYKNSKFVEAKKKTKWGAFIDGTAYGAYNMYNEFITETNDFLEPRSPKARLAFNLRYQRYTFGIWLDWNKGKLWVDNHTDLTASTIALTTEDQNLNTMMVDTLRGPKSPVEPVRKAFARGYLRFTNQETKVRFMDVISLLM